ncbi:MAG: hypothetical protein HYT87_05020 [Nitrospirae bacterium]|nr:hypothetical protein [Nitrospirota bacterium]
MDSESVVRGEKAEDARTRAAVDYALGLILGVEKQPDLSSHFTEAHAQQIRAAALLLNFTNRAGNTVDRWLFRLWYPGKVKESSFLADMLIALLWASVALPEGLWILLRVPRYRRAKPAAA